MPRNNLADLKALAVVGAIGFAVFLFGPAAYLTYRAMTRPLPPASAPPVSDVQAPQGRLGEFGSTCGGPSRLPCRPGLLCSSGTDFSKTGVCQKDEGTVGRTAQADRQLGEGCKEGPCAPGLYCDQSASSEQGWVCRTQTGESPNILKAKLEGSEPIPGGYAAASGTKLKVSVQTANADGVTVLFVPNGADLGQVEVGMEKAPGGGFASKDGFLVADGMSGDFRIRAAATGTGYSVLDLPFATKD